MMNIPLIFRTLRFLRIRQLAYQLSYRLHKGKVVEVGTTKEVARKKWVEPVSKPKCLLGDMAFSFIKIQSGFVGWNDSRQGNLWAYNLNYMDWLNQEGMDFETGALWIDRFVRGMRENRMGMDPYPIALRSINWVKFICRHWEVIEEERRKEWNDSLYTQILHLDKRLEYHLLGNHLLEDFYALFIAAIYFEDERLYHKIHQLLIRELDEEILSDGAHYEQSPMYHCILLDRLMDCYNFSSRNICFIGQETVNDRLKRYAQLMLGHLESIVYRQGEGGNALIPLLNDSAAGIAPSYSELCDYANRLGMDYEAIPLGDCGYRKMKNARMEAIVDVGNVRASYQPGHTHADTFNFELRLDGKPFVVDTGISTYNKTERRQYERSTQAHNTVTVEGRNSSEVWGGFRVGRRAHVEILEDTASRIQASHDGYKMVNCRHTRTFEVTDDVWRISDCVTGKGTAVAYLHLAPGVSVVKVKNGEVVTSRAKIRFSGASKIEILDERISTTYNVFEDIKKVAVHFSGELETVVEGQ